MKRMEESSNATSDHGSAFSPGAQSPDSHANSGGADGAEDWVDVSDGASLFKAIARTFGPFFLVGTFLKVLHDMLMFVSPQLLR